MAEMNKDEREAFKKEASRLRENYAAYRRQYMAQADVFLAEAIARNRK